MGSLNPVTIAAISTPAQSVAFGHVNGTITIQSFVDQRATCVQMHQHAVRAMRFSPDGRSILSGSEDKFACVLDIANGTGRKFSGHDGPVTTIDASDRGTIATGSGDHTVRVWETASGKELKQLRHPAGVTHLSYAPRGHLLATAGPTGITIFDGNDWKEMAVARGISVKIVRFSRDGKRLAYVTTDNIVRVLNSDNALDKVRLELLAERTERTRINDVVFDFSGDRLGICRNNGVAVWNHCDGNVVEPDLEGALNVWSMDFEADGRFIPVYTGTA